MTRSPHNKCEYFDCCAPLCRCSAGIDLTRIFLQKNTGQTFLCSRVDTFSTSSSTSSYLPAVVKQPTEIFGRRSRRERWTRLWHRPNFWPHQTPKKPACCYSPRITIALTHTFHVSEWTVDVFVGHIRGIVAYI